MEKKKMVKIPERTQKSKQGLKQFCEYINKFHDTEQLTILEIGSWTGVSAEIFARYFKNVYCVDPWKPTAGISLKYDMKAIEMIFDLRMSKYDNILKIKMPSKRYKDLLQKAKNIFKENRIKDFDVIYIDGLHTYEAVKEDIQLWKDRANLFICGHDYYNKFPGVKKAVNEAFGKPDKVFPDTSWLVKKR
jgi:hypothetical protein